MTRETNRRLVGGSTLVAVLIGVLTIVPPPGMSPEAMRAAALTLFAIVFWAMESLPGHITAFAFFLLAVVCGVSPGVVFSGFQSGGLWLAFSGLVLGIAIRRTGLAARLARTVVGVFGDSYSGLICGLVLVGIALMFLMASGIGRVLLLVPLAEALSERVGFTKGSPGASGFVMAAAVGTLLPAAAVLPANLPNLLLMGAAGTLHDVTMHYGSYLLLHLPVTGVLKAVVVVVTTLHMFPATTHSVTQEEKNSPLTRHEWMLSVVLIVTLGLWVSDVWHGIAPAWIGLGAAVFCLLPPVGLVPEEAFEQVKFSSLIYMAGIIGLGSLVANSGFGGVLGEMLLAVTALEPGNDWYNFAALVVVPTGLGLFTTMPGVPAVLTPLAADLAHVVGWPILTVLMTQVIGFSTVILPYQAPALVLAMERSGVRLTAAFRLLIVLAVLTLVVLTPLNYLWWHLLGYFPTSGW
jgi:anion transporter